jgi:hypothetical protein
MKKIQLKYMIYYSDKNHKKFMGFDKCTTPPAPTSYIGQRCHKWIIASSTISRRSWVQLNIHIYFLNVQNLCSSFRNSQMQTTNLNQSAFKKKVFERGGGISDYFKCERGDACFPFFLSPFV